MYSQGCGGSSPFFGTNIGGLRGETALALFHPSKHSLPGTPACSARPFPGLAPQFTLFLFDHSTLRLLNEVYKIGDACIFRRHAPQPLQCLGGIQIGGEQDTEGVLQSA